MAIHQPGINPYSRGIVKLLGQNYDDAFALLKSAADDGYLPAQTQLGVLFQQGLGIPADAAKAVRCWVWASKKGNADASYRLGMAARHGVGIRQDQREAARYLSKAAADRHTNAELELGRAYYHGWGVRQDLAECFYWYRRAAHHGHPLAQYYMGQAHEHLGQWFGEFRVVPEDAARAQFWYRQAAARGVYTAVIECGLMSGWEFTIEFKDFRRSAPGGDPTIQLRLGQCYFYKTGSKASGVPQDYHEAVRWIYKAAKQGNSDAENQLGLAFWFGNGVPHDPDVAAFWFNCAAQRNHTEAKFNLATHYYRRYRWSEGGDKTHDLKRSSKLFIEAAKGGHIWAQRAAGNACAHGLGVPQDFAQAVYWYTKALNNGVYDAQQNLAALMGFG